MTRALCDGCWQQSEPAQLAIFAARGVQVRYCAECAEEWQRFASAVAAEAARRQRELDLWEQQARAALRLYLTPLEFPEVKLDAHGRALVLG